MTIFAKYLYDYLTLADYFKTFIDEDIPAPAPPPSVHKPCWCTCPQWLVIVYSPQIEAWICCTCEGIVPDDCAKDAK